MLVTTAVPSPTQNRALAVVAPQSNPITAAILDGAPPSDCEERVNDTPTKLDACITMSSLWGILSNFQTISDQNPGPDGHGNRDTGTPGYEASVDYVAGLMRRAGYTVTIQQYVFASPELSGTPQFGTMSHSYAFDREWFVARWSGSGAVTAPVERPSRSRDGCFATDFAGFTRGAIALIERGQCSADMQVTNARTAGARAIILYSAEGGAYRPRLNVPAEIPVIGVSMGAVGPDLIRQYASGRAPFAHIDIQMRRRSVTDFNLIADSPFGDAAHKVVIEAHLDSIFGAGMLDNASGSTSILKTALAMAKTPTHNRLRYIWFGGEELGLFGSSYYTTHLTPAELHRIVLTSTQTSPRRRTLIFRSPTPRTLRTSGNFRRTSCRNRESATTPLRIFSSRVVSSRGLCRSATMELTRIRSHSSACRTQAFSLGKIAANSSRKSNSGVVFSATTRARSPGPTAAASTCRTAGATTSPTTIRSSWC
jgi:hypothetical protein